MASINLPSLYTSTLKSLAFDTFAAKDTLYTFLRFTSKLKSPPFTSNSFAWASYPVFLTSYVYFPSIKKYLVPSLGSITFPLLSFTVSAASFGVILNKNLY